MLWSHDASREEYLMITSDSEGRVRLGMEGRAAEIWDTRSHAHHNGTSGSTPNRWRWRRLKWCSEPSVHGGKRTAPTL